MTDRTGRTGQQDTQALLASDLPPSQRGDRYSQPAGSRRRRGTTPKRAAIYVRDFIGATSAAAYGRPEMIHADFGTCRGIAAVEGRQVLVTMTHADLGATLGAIRPGGLPDGVAPAMGTVLRWLRTGKAAAPAVRFEPEADPDDSGQWRVIELSDDEDRSGRIAGWTVSQYAQHNAGIAARMLTELAGQLPGELAAMLHYTPNEQEGS